MYKIATLNKIAKIGLDKLPSKDFEIIEDINQADAVLVRSAAMHDMELPESLLAVSRAGAGVNNIPVDKCAASGIVVFNTPGANANAVKELALAGLFLTSRNIVGGVEWAGTLSGDGVAAAVEKGKSQFAGPEIKGKTLGVIGLGAIGVLIANAAVSLGMDVIGYDPFLSVQSAWSISRAVKRANSASEVYSSCDYMTIHIPLNSETKYGINKDVFAQMKDGVRLLNFARGELVDNTDLKQALESGKISCYITDFPCEELIGVKNVICVPHLGASTPESEDNCAVMAANEVAKYLIDGTIENSVNYPSVTAPRTTAFRLCVNHKNIPNILSTITSAISSRGINIETMTNRSKGDYAYTILDIETSIPETVLSYIGDIEGVIRARLIK